MSKLTVLVLAVVACAASVVGCTGRVAGEAAPGDETTATFDSSPSTTRSSRATTSSSRPGSDGPLANVSPCDLLSEADRAHLGLTGSPKEETVGHARACKFSAVDNGFASTVAIFDTLGPDKQVNGARDRKPVPTVGRHQAEQWIGVAGGCAVSMTISRSSTVDTSASAGDDDKRACEIAMAMARVVEPKLP